MSNEHSKPLPASTPARSEPDPVHTDSGAARAGADLEASNSTRHEVKFALDATGARAAGLDHRLQLVGLRTLHPDRIVQSLYFDDCRLSAFEENLAGVSERRKVRLRWYGHSVRGVSARLEIKLRNGEAGSKRVIDVPGMLDIDGAPRASFVERLRALLPASGRATLASDLAPVQWVRYRRSYYIDTSGEVRVTLDRDLRVFDQFDRPRLSHSTPTVRRELWILELKAELRATAAVRRVAQAIGALRGRCSKYAFAVDEDAGPQPSALGSW